LYVFSFFHKLSFENSFYFLSILSCQTSFLVSKIENWKQKIRGEKKKQLSNIYIEAPRYIVFVINYNICKGTFLIPEPKELKNLDPKSPIQWICREWVRILGSNELDNNYSWPRWQESKDKLVLSKENRPWHNPRRLVLVYISFEFDYKSSSCSYSVFLLIFRSPLLRVFFLFYTVFLLSSSPSTCILGFWRWFLFHQNLPKVSGSSCKVKNYCSGITFTLIRSES